MMTGFDPIAVVVDWLDACRIGDVDPLLALYDQRATLACACRGDLLLSGPEAIKAYWQPKLAARVHGSFDLLDVSLDKTAVVLEYSSFEGRLVQKRFSFNETGQILHTECMPLRS